MKLTPGRISGSTQSHALPQHAKPNGKHFRSHEKLRQGQGFIHIVWQILPKI
jgi:hypothetical protein